MDASRGGRGPNDPVTHPCRIEEARAPGVARVLAPLAERYPVVRAGEIPPECPGPVRAMPVVLRLERPPAARSAVLAAAAAAALALCLDPRAQPAGEWNEAVARWVDGRIRKIARRARGAHWAAVQDLPGVTVDVAGAQVRALLPGPVEEVPRTVARLQIGGTDLPDDEPGPPPPGTVPIWLDPAVAMTVGKAAAQVGHASMILAAVRGLDEVPRFAVRTPDRHRWAELCTAVEGDRAVAVRDAGFTEVAPGTITCIAGG